MGRREDNKRRKREALEEAGLVLFLEQGYDRASVEQIAAAAGVARGTFYLYFDDKLALFLTLVDRWFEEVMALMTEHVVPQLASADSRQAVWQVYEDMGLALAVTAMSHQQAFRMSFREARRPGPVGEALRQRELRLQQVLVDFTEDVVGRGLLDVDHPRVSVLVVYGAVERIYWEVLHQAELPAVEVLAPQIVAMFRRMMNV